MSKINEDKKELWLSRIMAHLRRYFVEAIPPKPSQNGELSNGEIGRDYCNKLFSIEKSLAENSIRPFTVGRKNWEF